MVEFNIKVHSGRARKRGKAQYVGHACHEKMGMSGAEEMLLCEILAGAGNSVRFTYLIDDNIYY